MLPREHQKILKTYLYNKESYHGDVEENIMYLVII